MLVHVTEGLSQATGEDFALAPWIHDLVKSGRFGDKTKAGFYSKHGKDILTLNWKTLEYEKQDRYSTPEIEALLKLPSTERVAKAKALEGKHGDFLRKLLVEQSHYCLAMTPQLAYDLSAVDRAMEWGYGWEIGPFKVMDALGLDWLRAEFAKAGKNEPPLLKSAGKSFYEQSPAGTTIATADAGRIPLPPVPGQLSLAVLRQQGKVLDENREARCVDLGDGVLCLEFCGKMNTLGSGVLDLLAKTIDRIANGKYAGLVLGNDDPRTFTAGANLGAAAGAAAAGDWKSIEATI